MIHRTDSNKSKTKPAVTYSFGKRGEINITLTIQPEQLAIHKREKTLYNVMDDVLDVLNEVQAVVCLAPDVYDPRKSDNSVNDACPESEL